MPDDDLDKWLGDRGYLGTPGKSAAPSSSAPDGPSSAADDSFLGHGRLGSFARGVGKELTSEAIGLGQLVPGSAALSEYIPHSQDIQNWAMAPSEGGWETAGSWAGGALPWLLTPEARAGTLAAKLLGSGLRGGITRGAIQGAIQPTESGDYLSHGWGTAAGALTGGALGGLGGKAAKQATLKGFNKAALEAVVEPFNKHWPGGARPPLNDIGSKGVKEVQDWIQHAKNSVLNPKTPNKKQLTTDIANAEERLNRFLDASTGHYVDPQSLLDHFERPGNKTITSHILKDLAEQGRRAGVPSLNPTGRGRSWMAAPLTWALHHVVPGAGAGVHAAVHAGLHNLSRQAGGRSAMDELNWLARHADYLRRYGTPLATSGATQATTNVMRGGGGGTDYGALQDPGQDQ
jgi:hypothetical protein